MNSIFMANLAAKTSFNENKYLLGQYEKMSHVEYAKDLKNRGQKQGSKNEDIFAFENF